MEKNNLHRRHFIYSTILSILGFSIYQKSWSLDLVSKPSKKTKLLGLIGGTSWHSTIEYYSYLNTFFNQQYGDRINPPLIIYNLNQKQVNDLQVKNKWTSIARIYEEAALKLIKAGASSILLCSNTAHIIYDQLRQKIAVPILHIADATGAEVNKLGLKKVGLLGTPYTMQQNYIKDRLQLKFDLEVVTPERAYHNELGRIIYDELTKGVLKTTSKKFVIQQMNILKDKCAEGIILGCTEFPLLIKQKDYSLPLLDTTLLHCKYAIDSLK